MKNKEKGQKSLWKIVLKFITILVICYAAGFFTGKFIRKLQDSGINFWGSFEGNKSVFAYLILAVNVMLILGDLVYSIYHINKSKKLYSRWNGEDEEMIQAAEYGLDKCVSTSNIVMILELFLFAAEVVCTTYFEKENLFFDVIAEVIFLTGLLILIFVQRVAVQEVKKINPEKRGELLEVGFQKKWMESCDEAQKTMIGQAAYKAFRAVNIVCMALWVICIIGILSFSFGLVPVAFVTIIWLTLIISFQRAGRKLEYGDLLKISKH